jgi:hypothetical protein
LFRLFAVARRGPGEPRERSRRTGGATVAVLWLVACAPPPPAEIAGRYHHEGPVAATLEVRAEAGQYVVRLEGGGSMAAGAGSAADCVIEARGLLDGAVLRAAFGPVETETFSYSDAEARREGRSVEVVFEPGAAAVVEVDTLSYCGWDADLSGRYRAVG